MNWLEKQTMNEKPKSGYQSYEAKWYEALEKFPDTQRSRLELRVSPKAYIAVSCFVSFIVFDRFPSETTAPIAFKGVVDNVFVYISDNLANGLAELIDLDTGDTVTMDFKANESTD
jgi:hypothetical protein